MILHKEGASRYQVNFTIIKDSFIDRDEEVQTHDGSRVDHIPAVDEERTRIREERSIRNAKIEAAKIGEGVTDEAQYIFNALSKTLPCRWRDRSIVVLEEVEIIEPYGVEDCRSLHPGDSTVVRRVKKVLEAEKEKIALGNA